MKRGIKRQTPYHLPLRLELVIDDKVTIICGLLSWKVKRKSSAANKRPGKRRISGSGRLMSNKLECIIFSKAKT